jgi:hypothetical protein
MAGAALKRLMAEYKGVCVCRLVDLESDYSCHF